MSTLKVAVIQVSPETKLVEKVNEFIEDKLIENIHFPSLTTAYIVYVKEDS